MAEDTLDWSAEISAWRVSGKSGAAWCRDNGIGYYRFRYWQKKLLQSGQHGKTGQFVPLKISSTPVHIECNGVYVHVSSGFDPVLLREVISVLKKS